MRVLGIICAYIALILLIILCVKPIFKKISEKNEKFRGLNSFFTKKHILISIIFLVFLILHIFLSMDKSFSLLSAKLSLIFLVFSIVFGCLIKKNPKLFLKLHCIFSLLCLIASIIHIVEVKIF